VGYPSHGGGDRGCTGDGAVARLLGLPATEAHQLAGRTLYIISPGKPWVIYIYIYIYICVCVCVYIYTYIVEHCLRKIKFADSDHICTAGCRGP
jgi:hypothetical protein